jgi:DNA repair exonuclease SbcCD ATPase subunit
VSARIIKLEVENVKRLIAVQINPKGNTVVISGRNDQGKSSVLDSILFGFSGKEICSEPIRAGEKRARVFIELSEELNNVCTIERKFTPSGNVLEIRNKDGVPQKSPQALLDAITSKVAFDPLSFVRMKSAEQLEQLRKLVGLDFTELNAVRKLAFDERTVRNRELEAAKTRLAGYPFDASLPKELVSIQDLALKLGEAKAKNANNGRRRADAQSKKDAAQGFADDIKALQEKVTSLEKMLTDTKAQIEAKKASLTEANIEAERFAKDIADLAAVDESRLQQQIDTIQTTNAKIEQNNRYLKAKEDFELLEGTVAGLTAKIAECDADKAAQIEFATFPMPGLSFDEERGVLLNNVPFSQGSQARQLQAAVAIGLALNPKVKVILIRDGSLMDDESMALVGEMAEKNGAQIWIEIVNSKDPAAIVIEDGEVQTKE